MTILRAALVMLVAGSALAAQARPDFTGHWRLVSTSGVTESWDVADAMTIRQVVVDRTAAGAPTRPFVQALQIERTMDADVHTETIRIGLRGGVVGGVTTPGERPRSLSESAVVWRGDVLLIWQSTTRGDTDVERVSERAQEWSLDGERQLVIALRTKEPGQESRRGRLVYRRGE